MSKIPGWDERDYQLWSKIVSLPSYGLAGGDVDNPLLSRKDVLSLMAREAAKRFELIHQT